MATKMVDIQTTKPDLKELLSLVEEGTDIIFVEDDTPVARLAAFHQRIAGLHRGAIFVSSSFDEPLLDDFWMGNA